MLLVLVLLLGLRALLTAAIWPLPKELSLGNHTVWVAPDLDINFRYTRQRSDHFQGVSVKQAVLRLVLQM